MLLTQTIRQLTGLPNKHFNLSPVKSDATFTEEGDLKRCYQPNRLDGVTSQRTSVSVSHIARKKKMNVTDCTDCTNVII